MSLRSSKSERTQERGGHWLAALLVLAALGTVAGVTWSEREPDATPAPDRRSTVAYATPGPIAEPQAPATPSQAPAPSEDLELVGVLGTEEARQAIFSLSAGTRAPLRFVLKEGDANDWLEIRSIEMDTGRVTAILRRPVMRNRNPGAEVVFKLKPRGQG